MGKFNRLLLTGAAGALGTMLRAEITHLANVIRVTDRRDLGAAAPNEEVVHCDLSDRATVMALTEEVDIVVHMGAVAKEGAFDSLLQSNILGTYNVFEGSRKNGVSRIVWASSNHAIGFYPSTQTIDASVVARPDSKYGVSKVFGEATAQYYWDKFGLESVSMRIGSCFPEPTNRRMLATWLSYPDLVRLVECCINAPRVGHTIIYGASNNDHVYWDNGMASHIGFEPMDNAEVYRDKIEAATPEPDPNDAAVNYQGGSVAVMAHFED